MPRPEFRKRRNIPVFILFIIAFAILLSFIVMWLWNQVLVEVTGVKEVTFVQAAGLLLLSRILFGGIKGGPWSRRKGMHQDRFAWKERWKNMSEAERDQLKQRWKDRCNE